MKRSRIAAWSWAQHYVASSRKADGASVLLENLRKEPGYSDEDEFWSDFVSEKMTAAEFVRTLAAFLPSTAPDPDDDMSGDELEDSLALARKDGEPWFRDDPDDPPRKYHDFARLSLDPRAAALWLLSKPMRRHLVPQGLGAGRSRGRQDDATRRDERGRGEREARGAQEKIRP
jgi:hypothetical protein